MATVSAVVYEHHRRADGTYNVKIRVYHKSEKKFIDSSHFVTSKQLDSKRQIKDKFVKKKIDEVLENYRDSISDLGSKLNLFTADELRDYLRDKNADIDFIKFCTEHIISRRF